MRKTIKNIKSYLSRQKNVVVDKDHLYSYNGEGSIDEHTISTVKDIMREKPYCIEISDMPNMDEFNQVFSKYTYTRTRQDCMGGEDYTDVQKGVGFATTWKNSSKEGFFLFLPSRQAKQDFIENFSCVVVCDEPFSVLYR